MKDEHGYKMMTKFAELRPKALSCLTHNGSCEK